MQHSWNRRLKLYKFASSAFFCSFSLSIVACVQLTRIFSLSFSMCTQHKCWQSSCVNYRHERMNKVCHERCSRVNWCEVFFNSRTIIAFRWAHYEHSSCVQEHKNSEKKELRHFSLCCLVNCISLNILKSLSLFSLCAIKGIVLRFTRTLSTLPAHDEIILSRRSSGHANNLVLDEDVA